MRTCALLVCCISTPVEHVPPLVHCCHAALTKGNSTISWKWPPMKRKWYLTAVCDYVTRWRRSTPAAKKAPRSPIGTRTRFPKRHVGQALPKCCLFVVQPLNSSLNCLEARKPPANRCSESFPWRTALHLSHVRVKNEVLSSLQGPCHCNHRLVCVPHHQNRRSSVERAVLRGRCLRPLVGLSLRTNIHTRLSE